MSILVLSDDLLSRVVLSMAHDKTGERILSCASASKWFKRLLDAGLWLQLCKTRWPGPLPPTRSYRLHFLKRVGLEHVSDAGRKLKSDPLRGIHLMVNLVNTQGEPVITLSLDLKEGVKIVRSDGGQYVSGQFVHPRQEPDSLAWQIDGLISKSKVAQVAGVGASYLWREDERMSQLLNRPVAPLRIQDSVDYRTYEKADMESSDGTGSDYGSDEEAEGDARPKFKQFNRGRRFPTRDFYFGTDGCNGHWMLYDGGGTHLKLTSTIDVALKTEPSAKGWTDVHQFCQYEPAVSYVSLTFSDHSGADGFEEFPEMDMSRWSDVFRVMQWV